MSLPGVDAPLATHHTAHIGTTQVEYTASFAATVLKDDTGVPQATISATSRSKSPLAASPPASNPITRTPGTSGGGPPP